MANPDPTRCPEKVCKPEVAKGACTEYYNKFAWNQLITFKIAKWNHRDKWSLIFWYRLTYLQGRNRDKDVGSKVMDTKVGRGSEMNWEIGIDIYTRLCIKDITNENLPYSTGSSTQCLWWPEWEGNLKKRGYMCTYNWFTLLYSGNRHNIVKQLHSSKNKLKTKKEETVITLLGLHYSNLY